jgi:hypothetical protein
MMAVSSESTGSGLLVCSVFFDMKKFFIIFLSICSIAIACKDKSKKESKVETTIVDTVQSLDPKADSLLKIKNFQDSIRLGHRKDSILLRITQNILTTLKNRNYPAFADFIHPIEGIRFSPYGFIDTLHDRKLSKQKFISEAGKPDQEMMVWGAFDGTGDPIKMTLNNYLKRFVYDVDFVKPEKRMVNEFIGGGNSLNNLLSVYKDCDFTESHFSGFEEKYGGMDWKSLRLVFKKRNGKFLLVAVVHDEWTI